MFRNVRQAIVDLIADDDKTAWLIICSMLENEYVELGSNPLFGDTICVEHQDMHPLYVNGIVKLELSDRTRYKLTAEAEMILREAIES